MEIRKIFEELAKGTTFTAEQMQKAVEMLYDNIGFDGSNVESDIDNGFLTVWGDSYLWYMEEANEGIIRINDLHILDGEELEAFSKAFDDGTNPLWYAYLTKEDDNDWGTGTYDKNEALAELERNKHYTAIAVIELGSDPICVEIIKKGV